MRQIYRIQKCQNLTQTEERLNYGTHVAPISFLLAKMFCRYTTREEGYEPVTHRSNVDSIGNALSHTGDRIAAISALKSGYEKDPENPELVLKLCELLRYEKAVSEALF